MKILTWNCNGALRRKFGHLSDYNADIIVVQECENPAETAHKTYTEWANNYLWIGDNKNKGVGVFAKKHIRLERLNWPNRFRNHEVKYFLPCSINGEFELLAVWNHSNQSPTFGYIGQLWKYLQINKTNLNNCMVIGDFNSNKIWDKWDRWWNHSNVVEEFKEIGIESLYHKSFKEEQGLETQPTFYLQRNLHKPYHIDYVFGSQNFVASLKTFEIGPVSYWLKISDHLPLVCEF